MLLHRQGTKKVSLSKSRNDQPHSTVWHLFADPDPYPVFPLPLKTQTTAGVSPIKLPLPLRIKGNEEKGNFFSAGVKTLGRVKNLEKTSSQHRNRNQKLFSASSCGGSSAVPTERSGFLSGSPSKKEERKKEERQNEQDVEFETHSARGVSSSETGPDGQRLGRVAGESRKGKREEEKWMSESLLLFFC